MGFHSQSDFKKKRNMYMSKHRVNTQKRKNKRMHRRQRCGQIEPLDAQLMSLQQLKKRRTNPNANIALSGKKRNKLLKALRHTIRHEQPDEEEESEADIFESDDEEEVPENDGEPAFDELDAPKAMEVESSFTEESTTAESKKERTSRSRQRNNK